MFRSSRQQSSGKQNSNNDKHEGSEKQKQKKRLSFKEPEVEKARGPTVFKKEQLAADPVCVRDPNLEDLKLEDQALLIARNVGFAFVKPQREKSSDSLRTIGSRRTEKDLAREYTHEDLSFENVGLKSKTDQDLKSTFQVKDTEYLEALSPIKPGLTAMRCPVVELPSESSLRNPGLVSEQQQQQQQQQRLPTIAHHQIQLLNYQLEQQRQQTQTAMYQIQLLKDQLEAESAARYKAQVHNHHLMTQNRELLDHIQRLFQQVQELERKLDFYERKPVSLAVSSPEPKQGAFGTLGPNQLSSRRNSAGTQSLWSSTPSLNPSYNSTRAAPATPLTPPQLEPKAAESIRRLSIRDEDTPSKFSNPYDTDRRYRRRGSSGTFSLNKNRTSELSCGQIPTPLEAPRSPTISLSIPELKFTLDGGSGRREATSPGNGQPRGNKLQIGEPSKEERRGTSPTPRMQEDKGFKPVQIETKTIPPYVSKYNKPIDRESYESDSEVNQKKPSKSLGALRLFNS